MNNNKENKTRIFNIGGPFPINAKLLLRHAPFVNAVQPTPMVAVAHAECACNVAIKVLPCTDVWRDAEEAGGHSQI